MSGRRNALELSEARRTLLARMLRQQGLETTGGEAIRRDESGLPPVLSYAQERMFIFEQLNPGTTVYNLPAVLRLEGAVDADVLERCLHVVTQRQSALRATFALVDGVPQVGRRAGAPLEFELRNLAHVPAQQREAHAMAAAQDAVRQPFRLSTGPLVRALLLRCDAELHLLVLDMHHIVGDAWSWDLLLEDTANTYPRLLRGEAISPPPLPVAYADFARWQRDRYDGGSFAGQLAYWRTQLAGPPPVLQLAGHRARPAAPRHRGDRVRFQVPPAVVSAARELGEHRGVTMFMTTLAAFAALLYRYTGQRDLVVGAPVANRRAETERLVGLFVNTLPLRVQLRGVDRFEDVLERVRSVVLDATANQDVPFDQLVKELRPAREADANPYFQIMFGYRKGMAARTAVGPFAATAVDVATGIAKRDLTMHLHENGDTANGGVVEGYVEYDADLFEPPAVQRLVAHFQNLLATAVQDPRRRIADLAMLTAEEQLEILARAATRVELRHAGTCFHQRFEAQAARTPQAVAVRVGDETLTYGALNTRANQLAHRLIRLGVGPEVPVGVCLGSSAELVVAVLAVLKAGGAYVPLEPTDPAERLRAVVLDAGVRTVVTGPAGQWPGLSRVVLGADEAELSGEPAHDPAPRADPANAAYVLFTSGSSGRPKGVVVEHRQLTSYLLAVLDRFGLHEPLRYAMVQPLSVDSSVTVLTASLATGGELHVIDRARALDPDVLAHYMRRHEIDVLKIAPSHLRALQGTEGERRFTAVLPRRHLVVGGEASDLRWIRRIAASDPGLRVHNHYGPTETTVGVLTFPVPSGPLPDVEAAATCPIGVPLANTTAYVLDADLNPVPDGVPGELYIGGKNVARGYVGRAALTAQRFVPDPFGTEPGGRLYRTGDLVRVVDGVIEFLGRGDDQVKIRGHRVELGEIENVLAAHPSVGAVSVVIRHDTPGDPRVVAYVAARDAGPLDPAAVRSFAATRLPGFMVPAIVVPLDALPITPHGKVDKRALPAPPARVPTAPPADLDSLEHVVADVWKRVLDVDGLGAEDNFFDVGGHSLLVLRLHEALQHTTGTTFAVIELFRYPTVREQARFLRAAAGTAAPPPGPAAQDLERGRARGQYQHESMRARQRALRTGRKAHD